jgi:hypothetical protein
MTNKIINPEPEDLLIKNESESMLPKEKIAIWMSQQEYKNPGFVQAHIEKHGVMRFDNGYYAMYDHILGKSLIKIWAPGEYESDKEKFGKRVLAKALMTVAEAHARERREPFAQTSTGKPVFAMGENWESKHSGFSPEEHNDAARAHLDAATHLDMAGEIGPRDNHMQGAIEHIARAGDKSLHHKDYMKLMDKFYGD